ncbi:polymorphic toxin type 44 domain-containing protein [Campylobacter concisus]
MFTYNGEIPVGVDIEKNIKEIQNYSKTHSYDQTLYYFYLKVRNGGEWDYKRRDVEAIKNKTKSRYEDFGNWHYGVVGKAIGIPTSILLSAAGGAQATSADKNIYIPYLDLKFKLPFLLNATHDFLKSIWIGKSHRDFGMDDDTLDRENILRGIDDYEKGFGREYDYVDGAIDYWKKNTNWVNFTDSLLNKELPSYQDLHNLLINDPNGGISQDLADYILQTNRYNDSISIQIYDPLILDLNGNGKIDLTSTSNGVHFDHDANDISFKSSWVDKEDGLLVYDRNNNGIIDNGTELFGNFTRIASANTNSSSYENIDDANKNNNNLQTNNTTLAKHGYEALANLDSNNDGVIDINDKDFNKLRIWQDINKDGVSQTNELKTLDELNIKSLNLNYNEVNQDLRDNNTLTLKGSYTKTNGQTMLMGDINFNVDTINSKFKEDINLTPSQTKIPNVKGYGYLRDLNKAASIDTNLANILDNYSKSNTKEEQLKILPTLIKAWSDTSNNINNNLNPIEEPNNNDTDKTKDQRAYDISLTKIKLPNNISISDGTNVKVDSSGNIVSNDHKSARNLRLTPSQYRALMNNNLML